MSDIPRCETHGETALVVSCTRCRAWWAHQEALRSAKFWRDRAKSLRSRVVELERRLGL